MLRYVAASVMLPYYVDDDMKLLFRHADRLRRRLRCYFSPADAFAASAMLLLLP